MSLLFLRHPASAPTPPITCREALDFVMSYLDDDLAPQQRGEFQRHLCGCPSCINYLDTYKSTITLGRTALRNAEDSALGSIPERLVEAIRAARLKDASRPTT